MNYFLRAITLFLPLCLSLSILFSYEQGNAQERILLDISIIKEKGMDNKLVLKNELHTHTFFNHSQEVKRVDLPGSNRLYLKLAYTGWKAKKNKEGKENKEVKENKESQEVGPGVFYTLKTQLVDNSGAILKNYDRDALKLTLNKPSSYEFKNKKDQGLKMIFMPRIYTYDAP